MHETVHTPVLLQEVLQGLVIRKGMTVVDATLGAGGYAESFCEAVGKEGMVIGIDQDKDALDRTKERLRECPCEVKLVQANFRDIEAIAAEAGVLHVDAVVFDLGLSSFQLEDSGRGFSFQKDEQLGMTFEKSPKKEKLTAGDIVNSWSEEALADVFYAYGDERYARRIAKRIVEVRKETPIETTKELVACVEAAVPKQNGKPGAGKRHSATRVFQALRIAVNDEIEALKEGLTGAVRILAPRGRLAVVSFHSIEDRIVKHFFIQQAKENQGTSITKKPITPTEAEVHTNPRSRSAKLRIFEKL